MLPAGALLLGMCPECVWSWLHSALIVQQQCSSICCCALQVRHDRRVGGDSAVRFMTDGVLMRQLQSDFLLRSYSVILLDEAHERSLNTDLLLGE